VQGAQYGCAETPANRALLTKVRTEFVQAANTIEKLQ
jgi:hypothetical protein